MAPLGEEYVAPLRRGLREETLGGQVPNQGKGSGAFSSGIHGTHPFIMMNYDDPAAHVSTLAHELGHSMHSYFTCAAPAADLCRLLDLCRRGRPPTSTRRWCAPTCWRPTHDPDFQMAVLDEALWPTSTATSSSCRRWRGSNWTCHERVERGEGLTADAMSARLAELFREAYGAGRCHRQAHGSASPGRSSRTCTSTSTSSSTPPASRRRTPWPPGARGGAARRGALPGLPESRQLRSIPSTRCGEPGWI